MNLQTTTSAAPAHNHPPALPMEECPLDTSRVERRALNRPTPRAPHVPLVWNKTIGKKMRDVLLYEKFAQPQTATENLVSDGTTVAKLMEHYEDNEDWWEALSFKDAIQWNSLIPMNHPIRKIHGDGPFMVLRIIETPEGDYVPPLLTIHDKNHGKPIDFYSAEEMDGKRVFFIVTQPGKTTGQSLLVAPHHFFQIPG